MPSTPIDPTPPDGTISVDSPMYASEAAEVTSWLSLQFEAMGTTEVPDFDRRGFQCEDPSVRDRLRRLPPQGLRIPRRDGEGTRDSGECGLGNGEPLGERGVVGGGDCECR
ncbi:hypothetical protein QJS10_CPB17g00035 [Acorus calamus]|uniref:Uncharacterized protein n=1 Tax=Acorus calamus TaxID=4465 RepID=A0AAV9CXL5_ACOCL|nr:hypothetical protein QJS10_CPB17g00035 [Acorus calamus]